MLKNKTLGRIDWIVMKLPYALACVPIGMVTYILWRVLSKLNL